MAKVGASGEEEEEEAEEKPPLEEERENKMADDGEKPEVAEIEDEVKSESAGETGRRKSSRRRIKTKRFAIVEDEIEKKPTSLDFANSEKRVLRKRKAHQDFSMPPDLNDEIESIEEEVKDKEQVKEEVKVPEVSPEPVNEQPKVIEAKKRPSRTKKPPTTEKENPGENKTAPKKVASKK